MKGAAAIVIMLFFFVGWIIMMVLFFKFALNFIKKAAIQQKEAEEKRRKELQALAEQYSFSFTPEPHEDLLPQFSHFETFDNPYPKVFSNVLEGTFEDINWMIFDYKYRTPGGRRSSGTTFKKTVFCAYVSGFTFPQFALGPECFLVGWIEAFGVLKDIDFENFPEFSKNYCLVGKNEEEIRRFFTPQILSYFESIFTKPENVPKVEAKDGIIIFTGLENSLMDYAKTDKILDCLRKAAPTVKAFRKVHSQLV